jgi:hypothetical protein
MLLIAILNSEHSGASNLSPPFISERSSWYDFGCATCFHDDIVLNNDNLTYLSDLGQQYSVNMERIWRWKLLNLKVFECHHKDGQQSDMVRT